MTSGPLNKIRVLDLSRVLAGPVCTQILGDLGADILKIERPGEGDDTRTWGPPFLQDAEGQDTSESAYYLSANRNKRSIAVDIAHPEGQALIRSLLNECDILIENFKVGGLDKYGLGYDDIRKTHPHIIYCAITGFGQNGPMAHEPGYDFLAQAMGGLMAATGAADQEPTKAGVAISDIMTGLYAAIGILAALHHRDKTGKGQLVDLGLLDVTLASMTNIAQYYLTSRSLAPRVGNAHSTIVPYQCFAAADGYIVIAIGNNGQFRRFCDSAGHPEWADDPRFATNSARVRHRDTLVPMIRDLVAAKPVQHWVDSLHRINVPVSPVNTMEQAFEMGQVRARGMEIEMPHPYSRDPIHLVGSPLKLSETPVSYRLAPPALGQHTDEILHELLDMGETEISALKNSGVIA